MDLRAVLIFTLLPSSLFSHINNMKHSLFDDASSSDVTAVQNDVDTLMIKVEELQRKDCSK